MTKIGGDYKRLIILWKFLTLFIPIESEIFN